MHVSQQFFGFTTSHYHNLQHSKGKQCDYPRVWGGSEPRSSECDKQTCEGTGSIKERRPILRNDVEVVRYFSGLCLSKIVLFSS